MRQCVMNMVGDKSHDCWSASLRDHVLSAGYCNGDLRLFDTRAGSVTWEHCSVSGGLTSLTLLPHQRLLAATATGHLSVWDLMTRHKTRGYTCTDTRLDTCCVWSACPSPHDDNLIVTTLHDGSVRLVRYVPPGHRVMIGSDGVNVGTPGNMVSGQSHQWSERPVSCWSWCNERPGLALAAGWDQKIRVNIVTNVNNTDKT